jgi:hypothetical protein
VSVGGLLMRGALLYPVRTPSAHVARGPRRVHRRTRFALLVALLAGLASAGGSTALATAGTSALPPALPAGDAGVFAVTDAATGGSFTTPFVEPTIDGTRTNAKCIKRQGVPANDPTYDGLIYDCKPAGVSLNVMPDGTVMYYDGLEGTENINTSILIEYGHNSANDQSRVLNLHGNPTGKSATWSTPTPSDGGATSTPSPILPPPLVSNEKYNNGALFCSDNTYLPDGRILANGGTDYYNEPGVPVGSGNYGISELEGIKQSRIYDPATKTWSQTGSMQYGRWYPTDVALPGGKIFTASGVTKLVKPVYQNRPGDSLTNVKQTETYNSLTGKWTTNPSSADQSLPLFPRLTLLPDGKVFYNAAGQSFNPFGQSYDEAAWNLASVYDPAKQKWHPLGIPGVTDLTSGKSIDPTTFLGNPNSAVGIPGGGNAATIGGFRGSTFSMMLPLVPDASGNYTKASFLTAGGVLNPPSPGSYFTTNDSRLTTVDTSGGKDKMSTQPTGDLAGPRWYPSGVVGPTGTVFAFNGADRDEVALPGTEIANRQAEMFDPATGKWTPLAMSHDERTYHNTATLLPDGRILIGGHAPIPTLYIKDITLPGGVTAPNNGRDPSFEIYNPPYLSWGPRPVIASAPTRLSYGKTFQLTVGANSADIRDVALVRNTSTTHLVDGNQRTVELPVVARHGNVLTVKAPPNNAIAPEGAYMIFVNRNSAKGAIPSVAAQTFVGINHLEAQKH